MSNPKLSIIVAIGRNREIGKDNKLLWKIPEDMKRFTNLTTGHIVIMGRKTFESIPEKFRPLPNRTNIVISRNLDLNYDGVIVCGSLEEAIERGKELEKEEIFILGGGQIYSQSINIADKLYLTIVDETFDADTYFPEYLIFDKIVFEQEGENNEFKYKFEDRERIVTNKRY